ncbi:MAG TPA: peptidoglycan DD-metalloendopeptidase family protein [Allosphingosinicella sp.]|nr:peptidoglycan DD-metalloendopeptidase family protein [Allosphingosinicella sp.]
MRSMLSLALAIALAGWSGAAATGVPTPLQAQREAETAKRRSELLERQAQQARGEAARANADADALAARIEASEAEITAAQARIAFIEGLRREQRARLAVEQGPLIRLTAALQTMARRPPALALVQPGSLDDAVHVRALLASSLPAIRARTAGVRAEVARGNALRHQADQAVARLRAGQESLRQRRVALARFEQRQRARSQTLMASALSEGDRALALGEEARELATLAGTRQFQASLARRLAQLPPPPLPPQDRPEPVAPPRYLLPVQGRLLTGTGEISDAGVHARGLTFAASAGSAVIAPRSGRVAFSGTLRGYGRVLIIDHGGGWTTTLTNLESVAVTKGASVRARQTLARTGSDPVTVELRRNAQPVPIPLLL